jgi:hypothetical protein
LDDLSALALAGPDEIVASFERCERMTGREWIESARSIGALRVMGAYGI